MPLDNTRKPAPQANPNAWSTSPQYDSVDTEILLVRQYAQGMSGPLTLYADPVGPLDAVTLEYLQAQTANFVSMNYGVNPPQPAPGTALAPGTLWFSETDAQLYIWYQDPNSAQWVIANNTGIQDAPVGQTLYGPIAYGRANRTWVPVLALTGGIMTGSLILAWDPTVPLEAATKGYVDGHVAGSLVGLLSLSGGTMTGPLILSGPPGTNANPNQAATIGYVDSLMGVVPVALAPPASPAEGQLWFDSVSAQLFLWYVDGGYGQWVQANATPGGGSGGAVPPGTYVAISGSTMTGPLILSGPPSSASNPNQAATMGYVNSLITGQVSFIGTVNAQSGVVSYTNSSGYSGTTTFLPPASVPDTFLICNTSGVFPNGPLQGQAMNVGDWAISDGTQWYIISVQGEEVLAQDVTVNPAVNGATDVQTALGTFAPIISPIFQGTPTAPSPALTDNSQALATTAWVVSQGFITGVSLIGDVNSTAGTDIDTVVMIGDISGAVGAPAGQFIDDLTLLGDANGDTGSVAPDYLTEIDLDGDATSTTPAGLIN